MMKVNVAALAFALAGSLAAAQSNETTTKTKIDVKDGKDVKVSGCVAPGTDGHYVLTDVSNRYRRLHRYILVSDDDDFSKVVGQRVEVEGKAADRSDGKVEIKTETKTDGAKDTHSKTEGPGPYLGVKHMRRVEGICP